ncbi:hypothetical protein ACHAWF_006288 [Thalassiosira exigua]
MTPAIRRLCRGGGGGSSRSAPSSAAASVAAAASALLLSTSRGPLSAPSRSDGPGPGASAGGSAAAGSDSAARRPRRPPLPPLPPPAAALSPAPSRCERPPAAPSDASPTTSSSPPPPPPPPPPLECDYVVIGHGKAGRGAVRTLRTLDPSASVVVVDPGRVVLAGARDERAGGPGEGRGEDESDGRRGEEKGSLRHVPGRADGIDRVRRLVRVVPNSSSSTAVVVRAGGGRTDDAPIPPPPPPPRAVRFRRSVLVATGSRGAPPPEGCVDPTARGRVLELRSTSLPLPSPSPSSSPSSPVADRGGGGGGPLPALDPPTVRSLALLAASQGARVAILGSGRDALELAASCARAAPPPQRSGGGADERRGGPLLLFGGPSPLSDLVPRYLGAAISKRMRQSGAAEVEERSLVRYVSLDAAARGDDVGRRRGGPPPRRLEVYAVRSYDRLDSRIRRADLLVVAPGVDGSRGTAVVPSFGGSDDDCGGSDGGDGDDEVDDGDSHGTTRTDRRPRRRAERVPWSSLIRPPLLSCRVDDARVSAGPDLRAASDVYAAGSAARFPSATGRAAIAGGRDADAEGMGEGAARNMVRASRGGGAGGADDAPRPVEPSIPVWRSDRVAYLPSSSHVGDGDGDRTLSLYSLGIHALCVGRCDPDRAATHGFWWTNAARAGTRQSTSRASSTGPGDGEGARAGDTSSADPNAFLRRATRKSADRAPLPVYGSGAIFYLDRSGAVEGVLLWGLPFSEDPGDVRSDLNDALVERMKDLIRTNGGSAVWDHSDAIREESGGTSVEEGLLTVRHLSRESRLLASMALSGPRKRPGRGRHPTVEVRGRPLHRYVPIKSSVLTGLGTLVRRDATGNPPEEDDLFCPATTAETPSELRAEESGRPPSLTRIYPMPGAAGWSAVEEVADSLGESERRSAERSRPFKEEPLWLRPDDERRGVNVRDEATSAFLRDMRRGTFRDGRDAVKQAPAPRAYVDARKWWRSWSGGDVEDGGDGDGA